MNESIKKIEISTDLYSKEAIINATYKFTDKFYIKSDVITDNKVSISFETKDKSVIKEEDVNLFYNELIDQQIRFNVEKDYKTIREEIVKKAFSPISK